MPNLEYHKQLIGNLANEGITGEKLWSYVEATWNDAVLSTATEVKSNSATTEELKAFASFIADGIDLDSLLEMYEEEIFEKLEAMSDEELAEHKDFCGYEE